MPAMFWNRMQISGGEDPYRGRPLGRVLTKMGEVTREQVVEGLIQQKQRGGMIGETLVRLGYVTVADVDAALAAQQGPFSGPHF